MAETQSTLLTAVVDALERETVPFVLIGAVAMLAHDAGRSTFDIDFLTTDSRVLRMDWATILPSVNADVRRGDWDDPLAGVVGFERAGEMSIDLVLGRWKWQAEVVSRGLPVTVFGASVRVARRADLVVMKLDAGGPQDLIDAQRLLAIGGDELRNEVRGLASTLPDRLRVECERFLGNRP